MGTHRNEVKIESADYADFPRLLEGQEVKICGNLRRAQNRVATYTSAPPQLEPAPAVQPKQWLPVRILRFSTIAGSMSQR